jgi:hypothetical protein
VSTSVEGEMLHCARHPHTETVLRCGRCDTPICAKCMVMSPVGARCPTCAQVKRFALGLKPVEIAKAIGFGIGLGAVGTIILTFIPFLGLIGYAALGFGVGEVVSIGANRKRVPSLAPIAVACLFLGYVVGIDLLLLYQGSPFVGFFEIPLRLLFGGLSVQSIGSSPLIGLLIGALLAWMRVR